jgi:Protein of unknown function (DUF3500)
MTRHASVAVLITVVLLLVPTSMNSAPPAAADAMVGAANDFLASLNAEQKSKATFAFDDDSRFEFRFTPRARKGLSIKDMTEPQRTKAHALLKTGLSMRGYTEATTIMALETTLGDIERLAGRTNITRDPELYFVSIFGTPGKSPWGWKFEGHHLATNFTIVGNAPVVFAPNFFGSNPAVVRDGPKKGQRALREEEDVARELMAAFTTEQRAKIIYETTAPREMLTAENREAKPLPSAGITAADMTPAQRRLLEKLIDVYIGRVAPEVGKARLEALQKSGVDKISFAWAGVTEVGGPHYYRVQGPTFLIEYDNTQNDANHIHAVWRDFNGDFGRDVLREHLKTVAH